MSTGRIWQISSTGSADTEKLGELLGRIIRELRPSVVERSARRKRGTDRAVQNSTAKEYRSLQRSNMPKAAGAAGLAGWQGSGSGGGEVIELRSDLGGGKTTFVRGLVRGLSSKDRVSSPTFKLNNIYKADHLEVHHFDFYRLSEPGVMAEQLEESLQNPRVITVIEWSDIAKNILPEERLSIEFKPVANNPDERQIELHYPESKVELIEKLETDWTEVEP